ncbi:unknown similar to AMEV121 [Choristoneura biennis entomopoxvirus]|uniref:Uncharacterized protein n=1 Tax=Choristoneura biennis entomopoxvirus TaxID=10288 RepID=A0A916NXS9_CBEPV|nr:unknown similar to AMEV121 [Choristoneura biennis entomopoxvirus]CCU55737.1 unknown similar to AMEV121 [Choristoneura biennis entomopoxvirus]
MFNPSDFITIDTIEENINKISLEDECQDFIVFNKEYIYQYKNLFDNIIKLIYKLDEHTKHKIHKFFTNNISKLHLFKSKTLLPCYVAIYYLYQDKIILNATMCKYLFTLEIKQKKIYEHIGIISNITNHKIDYPLYDISYIIKGWVYTIDNNICKNLLKYFEIIPRLIIINLRLSVDNKDKLSTIPTHFDIYKKIDNYVFILLYYIYNYKIFTPHLQKIESINKIIYNNVINKSHYKIIYTKYIIEKYIHPFTQKNIDKIEYYNCCDTH